MPVTLEEAKALRRKCQTDLYFLGKLIFDDKYGTNSKVNERTHKPITDFFVQKNPDKPIAEQDVIKDRLILYPRTSYKSTWNVIDCVQWIISFPDIRIMVLTGADNLATSFVAEIQDHFIIDGEPTPFQILFPEFCAKPKMRRLDGTFVSPARSTFFKEPTVFASSIESNNSGWHVDVLKDDDVLTDDNTQNPERIERITRKFYMVRKLLMSYGYRDTIGTRYDLTDTYGDIIEKAGIEKHYGAFTIPGEIKYLNIPAWWVRGTDYRLPDLATIPKEDEIELLFPEGIPYKFLVKEFKKDRASFCSQYLNDPVGASEVTFTREECIGVTLNHTQLPKDGKVFAAWDLAYSARKGRDYTVGAVGLLDNQGRIFVIDMIRGRFQPHETPYMIAKAIKDWKPEVTAIEDIRGAQWLRAEVERNCQQMGVQRFNIDWFPAETNAQAKSLRIQSLKPLLVSGRLFFSTSIPCLEDLYREFSLFGPGKRCHDDIPDAISFLKRFIPRTIMPQDQFKQTWEAMQKNDMYDKLFGGQGFDDAQPLLTEEVSTQLYDSYTGLPS